MFGLTRRRVASFEAHVTKLRDREKAGSAGSSGFIDCFWPGTLVAENKSRGKDLDSAYLQAIGYFASLKERDLPQYVVVSDFVRIRIHDLDSDTRHEFPLAELPKQIKRFGFIAGNAGMRCLSCRTALAYRNPRGCCGRHGRVWRGGVCELTQDRPNGQFVLD